MRNIAFSIVLFALAVVQIAVVTTELPHSHVQTASVRNVESGARVALASTKPDRKPSAF